MPSDYVNYRDPEWLRREVEARGFHLKHQENSQRAGFPILGGFIPTYGALAIVVRYSHARKRSAVP